MIQVYLDSSDYSVMSDPRQPWVAEILDFLRAQVAEGHIEIRYSSLHLLEGAHVDESENLWLCAG